MQCLQSHADPPAGLGLIPPIAAARLANMFTKVLIANRGAIACRIIRTLRRIGVKSVAVYTDADALSRHVAEADEACCIGSGIAAESYLRADKILQFAAHTGAQAIHPGYGFLSEQADFAEQCAAHGIWAHRSHHG